MVFLFYPVVEYIILERFHSFSPASMNSKPAQHSVSARSSHARRVSEILVIFLSGLQRMWKIYLEAYFSHAFNGQDHPIQSSISSVQLNRISIT